jgi:hypothetical protein
VGGGDERRRKRRKEEKKKKRNDEPFDFTKKTKNKILIQTLTSFCMKMYRPKKSTKILMIFSLKSE